MPTLATTFSDLKFPAPSVDSVNRLPDGAVSVETDGTHWMLRASQRLQSRFEELLERRKAGVQTEEEGLEYAAIRDLDNLLSGFNRLARRIQQG